MPQPRLNRRAALAAVAAACAVGAGARGRADARIPTVAAAATLQFALVEAAAAFEARSGDSVRVVFGSSGNLARQIRQGAPYDVFLSADEGYALELARDGFAQGGGALYAEGRLALFVPRGSPLRADGTLEDLRAALSDGRVTRFAIANPEHAPYGRAAEETLRAVGLWEAIRPRLALGENVGQAARFAASGNAQGGIIAYSLALAPQVAKLGAFALIPRRLHAPLRQRMILTRGAGPRAQAFRDFLLGPEGREILRRHGFETPDDA